MSANTELFLTTWFMLLFVHFLADFPLQGDFLAKAKDPRNNPFEIWFIALFAHSMIHAGFVFLLTESLGLALLMFVTHYAIDMFKCKGKMGEGSMAFAIDQSYHMFVILVIAIIYVTPI